MARPTKEGLDYFPHDTDAASDEKIEALRTLYGNDGYAFYFILLERIYRTPNAEIIVSDAETREETRQILSKKCGINVERFDDLLKTSLKFGCFDKEKYEKYGILTSDGIKKRANFVLEKREEMRERYHKSKLNRVSASETREETREETQPETPQSKVKKSKVNNIYKEEAVDDENFLNSLKIEFSDVNVDAELKSFNLYWSEGNRKLKRPRFAFRNWLIKAREIKNNGGNGNNGNGHKKLFTSELGRLPKQYSPPPV